MAIVTKALGWAHRFGSIALGILLVVAIAVPLGIHVFNYWHSQVAAYTTPATPAKKVVAR